MTDPKPIYEFAEGDTCYFLDDDGPSGPHIVRVIPDDMRGPDDGLSPRKPMYMCSPAPAHDWSGRTYGGDKLAYEHWYDASMASVRALEGISAYWQAKADAQRAASQGQRPASVPRTLDGQLFVPRPV